MSLVSSLVQVDNHRKKKKEVRHLQCSVLRHCFLSFKLGTNQCKLSISIFWQDWLLLTKNLYKRNLWFITRGSEIISHDCLPLTQQLYKLLTFIIRQVFFDKVIQFFFEFAYIWLFTCYDFKMRLTNTTNLTRIYANNYLTITGTRQRQTIHKI